MKKLFLAALAGLILIGCGSKEQPPKDMPIEQKFIVTSVGHYVPPEDSSVSRARELIDRAAKSYGMSKELVADQAYVTYKTGKESGVEVSAMEVLEGATLAFVDNSGMEFSKNCAAYLTLRKSGMPHAEAMMGLKGLVTNVVNMGSTSRR